MELPAAIAAQTAILRQNVALSLVKQNAEQAQAIAGILEGAIQNAPVSSTRGVNLNTAA